MQPLMPKAGRGLAAFYFAVTITIGAYLSTSIVDLGMDYIAGRQEFRVFGQRLARPPSAVFCRRGWPSACWAWVRPAQ